MSENSSGESGILRQNCREDWPIGVCIFANLCGLTSTCIWFIVLFPQLWKNFRRKSVQGLSFLWAVTNFTASLINLFFVFKLEALPTYVKIQAVYQPTLEFIMLVQFWIYESGYKFTTKLIVAETCVIGWTIIIILQLTENVYGQMEWVSIVLWSVETFPQVILNMKMQSTSGQATKSVLLSLVGKTTDFLSTYLLLLPVQYIIMAYFSSSMCYINGLQVVWYWRQDPVQSQSSPEIQTPNYDLSDADVTSVQRDLEPLLDSPTSDTRSPTSDTRSTRGFARTQCIRVASFAFLGVTLGGYLIGLLWNTRNGLALLAPVGIVIVLGLAWCYFYRCAACKERLRNGRYLRIHESL